MNITIDSPSALTFSEADVEARTIRGLAVPFGLVAESKGHKWTFAKGVLSWVGAKLLVGHKWDAAIGTAEFTETDEGLELAPGRVARTTLGDEALELAASGTYSGLSIGLADDVQYVTRNGVRHVTSGTVREVSITPLPAFTNAAIRSVAASAADNQEEPMPCATCGLVHADGVTECTTPTFSADQGAALAKTVEDLTKKVEDLTKLKIPAPELKAPQFQITAPPLYCFDGTTSGSGHDFSSDIISAVKGNDEAKARVLEFMSESVVNPHGIAAGPEFVATTDVPSVNPSTYRPDMFRDEEPEQPAIVYDAFYAGGLSDVTPFFYSKMGPYSGLIKDHVEGTAPTAGSFKTETGATITPSAVSGRLFVTREVADQGGNPQVSGLMWSKFQRVFREMLETKSAKLLHDNIAAFTPLATIAPAATGLVAGEALKGGLVDLAFTANGSRFTRFFSAKELYRTLSHAKDGADRPLYPIIGANNSDGTTTSRLGGINVAGIALQPTWATEIDWNGATAGGRDDTSFYVDPSAAKVWNSGLVSLDKVGETAAGWNIDVFAYVATHLYDATGIRKVEYKAAP